MARRPVRPGTLTSPLVLSRQQILAFRRRVGALDERLPPGRRFAPAGCVGRAAGQHAAGRAAVDPRTRRRRRAIQLGGHLARPALGAAVPGLRDRRARSGGVLAGTVPGRPQGSPQGEDLAARLHAHLDGARMPYGEAGARARGARPERAAVRGSDGHGSDPLGGRATADRLDGAAAGDDPFKARLELARRHLHVFGPTTPEAFAPLGGDIGAGRPLAAFVALRRSLTAVRTPLGDAWILTRDEPSLRADPGPVAPARLLPSGDAYYLLQGDDRALLVPNADQRGALWTSRVWPGAVLRRRRDPRNLAAGARRRSRSRPGAALPARHATPSRRKPRPCRCPVQGRIVVRWNE